LEDIGDCEQVAAQSTQPVDVRFRRKGADEIADEIAEDVVDDRGKRHRSFSVE